MFFAEKVKVSVRLEGEMVLARLATPLKEYKGTNRRTTVQKKKYRRL